MIQVTHAYGTTRKAKVLKKNWRPEGLPDKTPSGMLLVDEFNEGHVCVGDCGDMIANEGDTGLLTFTKGGPTGGYWKFTKDK